MFPELRALPTHIAGVPIAAGDWDESKHPRDKDGKFGDGGGSDRKKEIGKELDRRHEEIQRKKSGDREAASKEAAKAKSDSAKAAKALGAMKAETPIGEAAKKAGVSTSTMQDEIRTQAAAGKLQLTQHIGPIENLKDPSSAIVGPEGKIYVAAKSAAAAKIDGIDKFSKGTGEIDRAKLKTDIAASVKEWKDKSPADMPVHELWASAESKNPGMRLGQFHDSLRELHEAGTVRMSGFSGPLTQMKEPVLSLLIGHKVQYYARPG